MRREQILGLWLALAASGCADEPRVWNVEAGGLRASVDTRGLHLSEGTESVSLAVVDVRRPGAPAALTAPTLQLDADGARLERGSGITEWAALRGDQLEHGVTLGSRPPGEGPLTVTVQVDGARPRVDSDGRGAELVLPSAVLRYGELAVLDATGRALPAHMEAYPGAIRVELDDSGARYPVVVDPTIWSARAPIEGPGTFGESVAVLDDAVLVGSPSDDLGRGAVRVYGLSGDDFVSVAKISPPDGEGGSAFGSLVAAGGGVVAVVQSAGAGAWDLDLFELQGGVWTEVAHLPVAEAIHSVATDGSTVLAGTDAATLVFEKPGGSWVQVQALDGPAGTEFGTAVAVSGSWALVGARSDTDAFGTVIGTVRAYERVAGVWTEQQVLTASDATPFGNFGWSLAMDGSRAVVGSMITLHGLFEGEVYVLDRAGASWSETTRLFTINQDSTQDRFGTAVGLSGDHIMVGSPDASLELPFAGALNVFSNASGAWLPTQRIEGPLRGGKLGAAVSMGPHVAAVAGKGVVRPFMLVGQTCADDLDCWTGHCVDGFCCDRACDLQCEACDVAGTEGVCSTIIGKPHADHPACDASCTDGVATPPGQCGGGTTCEVPPPSPCSPFVCGDTACLSACQSSSDCAAGFACDPASGACTADAATCDGDHTLSRPDGSTESCAPYRCSTEGACLASCAQTGDCASGFVCDASGVCTSIDASVASGCSLDAAGSETSGMAVGVATLAWALARRRRRRAR